MADPTCSVEDCVRPLGSRGMCKLHYERKRMAPKRGRDCGTCGARIDGRRKWCSDECRPTCSFRDCTGKIRTDSLCQYHYGQKLAGRELSPMKHGPGRLCRVCGEAVPIGFRTPFCSAACRVSDARHDGSRPTSYVCVVCGERVIFQRAHGRRMIRSDIQYCAECFLSPEGRRYRFYKVTPAMYQEMAAGGCRICGTQNSLHIDHDHSCCGPSRKSTCGDCVRGVLCGSCNRALGLLQDDPERLLAALQYLEMFG